VTLPKVGLEAAIENLGVIPKGASIIVKSYDTVEKKAGDVGKATQQMGLKFDEVANRWRTATGQFASNAQLMAAGIENPKKAIERLGKSADTLVAAVGSDNSEPDYPHHSVAHPTDCKH